MKHWSIASSLVTFSLGALLTACGGAEMNDGSELSEANGASDDAMSNLDQVEEEVTVCDDTQYDHWKYLSALAVATANELGRWNAAKDFVKENAYNGPRIALSAEGLARCNPTGCPNVSAILQLQNSETSTITRHDPNLLRQYMVTYFDRQKGSPAPAHELTFVGTEPDLCGLRYIFEVDGGATSTTTSTTTSGVSGTSELKPTSAYKCLDIVGVSGNDGAQVQHYSCGGGSNQKFTVEASGSGYRLKANNSGKCLGVVNNATNDGALLEQRSCGANNSQVFQLNSKGNNLFELKNVQSGKCIDIQSGGYNDGQRAQLYACHGGANQTFQAAGLVSGSSGSAAPKPPAPGVTPASLWSQLKFAGENENKYLMFKSDANSNTVSIDPMATMVTGGAVAQSGACFAGALTYSEADISGDCCTVSSKFYTLKRAPFNARMYQCK
jgi:hypothetical protein